MNTLLLHDVGPVGPILLIVLLIFIFFCFVIAAPAYRFRSKKGIYFSLAYIILAVITLTGLNYNDSNLTIQTVAIFFTLPLSLMSSAWDSASVLKKKHSTP